MLGPGFRRCFRHLMLVTVPRILQDFEAMIRKVVGRKIS